MVPIVLPLFSGNKKNQILEVLFHEMKKGGKKESDGNEMITYHAWEGRIHAGFETPKRWSCVSEETNSARTETTGVEFDDIIDV